MTSIQIIFIGIPIIIILSYIGVGEIRKWADRRNVLDIPNERSSHSKPTPKGGGIVIVCFTLIGLVLTKLALNIEIDSLFLSIYIICSILIAGISLLDDIYTLKNSIRFAVQGVAAILIIYYIGSLQDIYIPLIGTIPLGWLGYLIAFIWLTGLTNVYNFMDGIDGIAAIQAIAASLGWLVVGFLVNDPFIFITGMLLLATNLGFIFHNWQPARIFMGDVGSAFIGFSFAFLTVYAYSIDARLFITGVLFVWPFIFDGAYTLCRRILKKENIFQAHRSHLYQRLVVSGSSHRFVSILYGILALVGVIIGLSVYTGNLIVQIISFILLIILCVYLLAFVLRREMKLLVQG